MRRYLRVVGLCLACGFCSLLYAFSQLAVSLEEGAAGGRRPQAAAMGSWLADSGRGPGRGAGRYGPQCRVRGSGSPRGFHHRALCLASDPVSRAVRN
ncbi:glucoside xylosyltransferase 1 [Cricetulus griseus]|nr:glucoside xylosyltransferase 1 [Cricetulus griseus]